MTIINLQEHKESLQKKLDADHLANECVLYVDECIEKFDFEKMSMLMNLMGWRVLGLPFPVAAENLQLFAYEFISRTMLDAFKELVESDDDQYEVEREVSTGGLMLTLYMSKDGNTITRCFITLRFVPIESSAPE